MRKGILLAFTAYLLWGLFPLYFRLLQAISPLEMLAHRMVWSLVFLGAVLTLRRQWSWLRPALRQPRVVGGFAASAVLLSGNWFIYIWAVNAQHVVDASLGYYINPLVSILLGAVLLRERLRPAQWTAVALAAVGVGWLTWHAHGFPWIGVSLALSFGTYGLLRKTASLGPLEGLSLEILLLCPFAVAYLAWTLQHGDNGFQSAPAGVRALLMAAGPITAIPLLMFAAGARRIPLSTLGVLQYVAPTLQLLLGVWLYGEPFSGSRVVGFVIIWIALALFSLEGVLQRVGRRA